MSGMIFKVTEDGKEICALMEGKEVGKVVLSISDKTIIIESTFVNDSYQGQGIGHKLVSQVVELAKKSEKKVMPLCPFAKKIFDNTPEFQWIRL